MRLELLDQQTRAREMAALDALPLAVREAITAARVNIPPIECLKLINAGETVEFVVAAISLIDNAKCQEYRRKMATGKF